ncbi:MAG: hypothetical protein F6K17_15895 [Okeania sp. SIO3C4]|nr:hypothetical protein [Okeania sp. SIO3C4]
MISPDSVVSENCQWELTYARSFNKRLINVYLKNPRQEPLPKEVEKIQWIDFQKHYRDFHKPLSELIRTIDNQRDHVREQTIWLKAAQKWEKFGKDYDRLLKGGDYLDAEQWLSATKKSKQMQQPTPLIEEFINASKEALDNAEKKKQRSRRFLISALAFVTIFSIISVILGLYAFYQREKLRERAKVIEQQKAELLQKTQQLQETIDAVQKAETELRNRNDEISRLQQQRDSAASRANTTKERIEIMKQYNVNILDQKDKIEREKIKVQQKAKQAQAELEQLQNTQTKTPTVTEVETFVPDVPFFDGRAKDYHNGKWGYIDKKGKVVIRHQFDRVADFSNGVALVWKNGQQVFIDVKGKPKSEWLDDIDPFSDGLAEVKKGRTKSFINTRGEIISKWFEDAYPFRHGRAKVKLNGRWGYINKKVDIVISPVFTNAFGFRKRKKEGISAKVTKDGVSYLIDKNGRRVGVVSRSFIIEADEE